MADSDQKAVLDCPCVGSMGLHQNNVNLIQNNEQFNGNMYQFKNRSVIDVFRGMRDRYFGKPEIISIVKRPSNTTDSDTTAVGDVAQESIDTLPVYCKLMILSFLDTEDVCSVSALNSHWREVANDQVLWRELLIRDMCKWDSMTNRSHPLISQVWNNQFIKDSIYGINFTDLYDGRGHSTVFDDDCKINSVEKPVQNIHAENGINFKALYIHSSFQRKQDDFEAVAAYFNIPGFIKSLWQSSEETTQGEIIMIGPGMESPRTSKIFRALMWGSSFLDTKGLLPGNRDGIGSGVQLIFKAKISFNLIAMYSANNRIRESRIGIERLLHSNVVEALPNDGMDNANDNTSGDGNRLPEFVLNDAVRLYIAERRAKYKLVYVVDASANQKWEDVSCNRLELAAILKGTEIDSNIMAAVAQPAEQQAVELEQNNQDESNSVTSEILNSEKRPLLVLSCIADQQVPRFSCMQITAMLDLPNVTDRQWRVQDVIVSNMLGVELGLDWLLRQS